MRKNGGIAFPGKSCAIQFMRKNEILVWKKNNQKRMKEEKKDGRK